MTIPEIETQFAYNEWANGLLLSAAASLQPEEQTRNLGSSHRSVLGTLFHLVYSEWDWLHCWQGKSWKDIIREEPPESDFPNIAILQPHWVAIASGQKAFVATLTDPAINRQICFENFRGELWEFSLGQTIQHLLNHSAYHRGQVVTLLRQLGKTPPTTDFLVFLQKTKMSTGRVT